MVLPANIFLSSREGSTHKLSRFRCMKQYTEIFHYLSVSYQYVDCGNNVNKTVTHTYQNKFDKKK